MSVRPQEPQVQSTRGEPIPHSYPSRVSQTRLNAVLTIPFPGSIIYGLRFQEERKSQFNPCKR